MEKRKKSLFAEFARMSRSPMAMVSVAGLLFIPLLYSGMLLGAFWDPYGKLDRLPVAVVNEDAGAVMDGRAVKAGEDLARELRDHPDFRWAFTDEAEAMEGLREHRYAMAFVIPEDFSKNTTTLTEEAPTPARIRYYVDDGWNYLNSRIGAEAADRLKSDVSKSVTKAYAESAMDSIGKAADGFRDAGDGAAKLADGAETASEGALRLRDNLAKLENGALRLEQGFGKLNAGAAALADGAGKVSSGASALADGMGKLKAAQGQLAEGLAGATAASGGLADGSSKLADSAGEWAGGAARLKAGGQETADGASRLATGLEQYAAAHEGLADDAEFRKLLEAARGLSAGADGLASGASELGAGAERIAETQERLAAGTRELRQGLAAADAGMGAFGDKLADAAGAAGKLAEGAGRTSAGADGLRKGLQEAGEGFLGVKDGTSRLADGSQALADGVDRLTDGSRELSGKLGEAAEEAGSVSTGDKQADMFAEPVAVDENKLAAVPNYGTGMTPYFLSLGLYVGVLLSTVILPLRDAPDGAPRGGFGRYASKALLFAPLVLGQTVLVDTVLLYGIGLHVPDVPLFYAVTALIALAFMAILQFLISLADQVGRFLGVVLLTLQLASSAGTYPAELLPDWLQRIGPWMPMTYAIRALRLVIEGAPVGQLRQPLAVLAGCGAAFAALTVAYFRWSGRRGSRSGPPATPGRLVPAAE